MIDVIILLHEVRQHTSEELRDVTLRSSTNLTGTDNGLCRSLYKAMGYSEEELTNRPVIGIANSWSTLVPGHYNLRELADFVRKGIYRAGGTAVEFGVISCCDGITNGHEGMKYILPAREVVCNSVEIEAQAHRLDALVLLASCDKILPGMLMAAAPGGCKLSWLWVLFLFGHGQHHGLCQ